MLHLRGCGVRSKNAIDIKILTKPGKRNVTKHLTSSLFHYQCRTFSTCHKFNQMAWVWLNRLCTCIGQFESLLLKWELTTTAACDCVQNNILYCCLIYNFISMGLDL